MSLIGRVALLLIVTLTLTWTTPTTSLRFYMHDRERRCFRLEAPFESRIVGHASIANGRGPADLSIEVKDKPGAVLYQSHSGSPDRSSFSFRTPKFDTAHADRDLYDEEEEAYDYDPREVEGWLDVCLLLSMDRSSHDPNGKRAIVFWIRPEELHPDDESSSAPATDSDVHSVSKSLQNMQDVLKAIITDMVSLQQRERRLVDHNQGTARYLVTLTVFSLFVLAITSGLQFMHFKSYFKSKKLL